MHYTLLREIRLLTESKLGYFGWIYAQEHNKLNRILTKSMGIKYGSLSAQYSSFYLAHLQPKQLLHPILALRETGFVKFP